MSQLFTSTALGLDLSSLATLGKRAGGQAATGDNAIGINLTTGNLVVQHRDELILSRGEDLGSLRTYNSQGLLNDDNADNWGSGFYKSQLKLTGTANTAGSTIKRIGADGSEATYTWSATRAAYVTTAGEGAFDSVTWSAASRQYTWRDGATQSTQTYNTSGRLISTQDATGNATTYTYNAAGLITQQRSATGETLNYDYTGTNLTQIRAVTADGKTQTRVRYGYDTLNRLTRVTADLSPADNSIADGKTHVTTYTYDGNTRRLASITTPEGNVQRFTYTQAGSQWRINSVTDATGTTTFTYSTNRTAVTSPLGLVTFYDFDASGQLTALTTPANQITRYTWDAAGNLTRITAPDGLVTNFTFDANGNCTREADTAGRVITRSFDSSNRLTAETRQGAGTARFIFDATNKGWLRFELTPEGRVREHRYNAFGERITTLVYATGTYTGTTTEAALTTWAAARKASVLRTDYTFDARSQLASVTTYDAVDANGNGLATGKSTTQTVFDARSQLLQTLAPNGTTTYTYDGLGRELTRTNALGQTATRQYDQANNRLITTAANGLITTQAFDKVGRLISTTEASSTVTLGTTRYTYDANNRLVMTEDARGNKSFTLYDTASRKVADIDPDGTLTETRFDAADRQTIAITYATAVDRTKLINAAGTPLTPALASLRPAANAADQWRFNLYDAAGRLSKTVSATGRVTETRYDTADRAIATVEYANRIDITPLKTATTLSANPVASTNDRTTRYFFDADGNPTGSLDAEGFLVETTFNAAGQKLSQTRYATATASALRASGTLAQLRPASHTADQTTQYLWNAENQLIGTLDAEGYFTAITFDAAGNKTSERRYATRTTTLVAPAASATDQTRAWAYDALGRITSETSIDGTITTHTFDAAGNRLTTTVASGTTEARTHTRRFDLQGRLIAELTPEGASLLPGKTPTQIETIWQQHSLRHTYDAAGNRTSTTDQNALTTVSYTHLTLPTILRV